jgi:benzoate/toluate 1,2-dioxygenase subunit beta
MDEGRYADWLALWSQEDVLYWVPCGEKTDPRSEVSIIYDDRERLIQRVERLMSGTVLAVEPRPRMRRVVSNIEIVSQSSSKTVVESNFVLGISRYSGLQFWAGRNRHELCRLGAAEYKIRQKRVDLINADQEIPLLQFLI